MVSLTKRLRLWRSQFDREEVYQAPRNINKIPSKIRLVDIN